MEELGIRDFLTEILTGKIQFSHINIIKLKKVCANQNYKLLFAQTSGSPS